MQFMESNIWLILIALVSGIMLLWSMLGGIVVGVVLGLNRMAGAVTGPLLVALDDTLERRRGAQIAAKGIYRDPVRSSQGHFVKASGLRWLLHQTGCDPSEVMAIGDNYNDLEMLQMAGCPVVMGNSSPGLNNDGWHLTRSNDEDGVAAAIHEHVLK